LTRYFLFCGKPGFLATDLLFVMLDKFIYWGYPHSDITRTIISAKKWQKDEEEDVGSYLGKGQDTLIWRRKL